MPILAFSLAWNNCRLWATLRESDKNSIASWLLQINDIKLPENNWQVFRVVVNVCLKLFGADYSEAEITRSCDLIDSFYEADGWYSDGMGDRLDHYVAMSIHFYLLLIRKIYPDIENKIDVEGRAREFAKQYSLLFSTDGDALPFGRSLSYRFAHASFWGALAVNDIEALPWGEAKGLYLRNLRYWLQQPIFLGDGQLSVGYTYPNSLLAEYYIGPGSPYWALCSFLPLILDDSHPFWRAKETCEVKVRTARLDVPGFLVSRSNSGGSITVLSGRQESKREFGGSSEKYCKFAYSNKFGFSISRGSMSLELGAFDSVLALKSEGSDWIARRGSEGHTMHGNEIRTTWSPLSGVTITTRLFDLYPWHLRVHEISSEFRLSTAEGAFSVPLEEYETGGSIRVKGSVYCFGSGIMDLNNSRTGTVIEAFPNTNILFNRSAIPMIVGDIGAGQTTLACLVLGDSDPHTRSWNWRNPPEQTQYRDYLIGGYSNEIDFGDLS